MSTTVNNQSQADGSPNSDLLRTDLQQSLTARCNENAYYSVEFREFGIIKSRNFGNEQYNISFDYFIINYGSYGLDGYANYAYGFVDLNNSNS